MSAWISSGLTVSDFVVEESFEDVDCFPYPAGDESGEPCGVGVGDVAVGNASVSAVADRGFGEEVVVPGVDLGSVGADFGAVAPDGGGEPHSS